MQALTSDYRIKPVPLQVILSHVGESHNQIQALNRDDSKSALLWQLPWWDSYLSAPHQATSNVATVLIPLSYPRIPTFLPSKS